MQGYSDIDELKLSTISGYFQLFTADPQLRLLSLFPTTISETDSIKWDSTVGGRGMVPFKGPGQETPMGYSRGIAQHEAKVAFFGQKRYYDEEFLNNLRQPGTTAQKMVASQKLSMEMAEMGNMSMRRREWMISQMLWNNGFTYKSTGDTTIKVDYGIPSSHIVTVTDDKSWDNGGARTILADFNTANRTVRDACGATIVRAISNSSVLEYIASDNDILTLLSKSTFGDGNLFSGGNELINANPSIIGNLFHKNLIYEVYDEQYEVRANLTAVVTASSTTTISVDDAADFVAGGTLTFVDASAGTSESETIASVDEDAGTVTVSSAPSTSYKATEDYVYMNRPFIPDDYMVFFADRVQGQNIAEMVEAPFGIPARYGMFADTWDRKDPEGIWLRVQDKCLPVLKITGAVYALKVKP